ncbi:MAG: septal ring lytic transglycosylase RlpA family protein [Thiohalospira sp.]
MKKAIHKFIVSAFMLSIMLIICTISNAQDKNFVQTGLASFYADKFEGRTTANGEIYYHIRKTAAHPDLPFGSVVKVTNLGNNKFVVVRINDRGPFVQNRIIDLSKSAAEELGFIDKGLTKVRVELIASTDDFPGKEPGKSEEKPDYYQLDVKKASPAGKGVQIGSFSSNENVLKLVERLKYQYNEPVYIEVAETGEYKLYRVIIGIFSSENEAKKLGNVLKNSW